MEKCLLCTVPLPVNTQPKHSRRKKWSLKCFWTLVKESRDISTSQFPNLLSNQPLVLFKYASPLKGSSRKKKISDAGLVLYSKGRYKVQHCHKSAPQTPGHLQEGQHANVFWHLRVNPGSQSVWLVQKDTQQWPGGLAWFVEGFASPIEDLKRALSQGGGNSLPQARTPEVPPGLQGAACVFWEGWELL